MSLTARRREMAATGYGASEVGTICGLNPWSSQIRLYEERVHGRQRDEAGLAAELGLLLEQPLAKKFSDDTGLHLAKCATLRHQSQSHSLAIATPDRIAFGARRETRASIHEVSECAEAEANVQIKTASMWGRKEWGEPGTDAVPPAYLAQVQWEMAVTGLRKTYVPVLFDRAEWAVFEVGFDVELFERIYGMVERFHVDHVLAQVPPAPDASEHYRDFLFGRFGLSQSKALKAVEPGSAAEKRVMQYRELKRLEGYVDTELKRLGSELRGAIGDDGGLSGPWGKLTWLRAPGKSHTDWEALARGALAAEQLSGLVPHYQRERAPYDQLRAKFTNEEE